MLTLVLAAAVLAFGPPVLPDEPPPPSMDPQPVVEAPVEGPAPAEPAPVEPDSSEAFVIEAGPPAELPRVESSNATTVVVVPSPAVVEVHEVRLEPPVRQVAIPRPPWSGSGRLVGGPVMLIAGLGLLTAATFELASTHDTSQPLISQVPAGVSMLVAGGLMIGTGLRDQGRLGDWEATTKMKAPPTGNGLIVGGVSATSLGIMAGIATSIAADMDLDAPRSIPAGWATTGVTLAAGTTMLVAGIVRRARYGHWMKRSFSTPMVVPVRAGAALGVSGQF